MVGGQEDMIVDIALDLVKSRGGGHRFAASEVVVAELVQLVHSLVQDGDDADRTIRQHLPINEVPTTPAVETRYAENRWNRPPRHLPQGHLLEIAEQLPDVCAGLILATTLHGVTVEGVESLAGGLLDPVPRQLQAPSRLRFSTVSAVRAS